MRHYINAVRNRDFYDGAIKLERAIIFIFKYLRSFFMSILAWFRGLFGRPTKKRQIVDNENIYKARQYFRYDTLPRPGKLNELEVRFILSRFATSTPKQVARKLNKMGYLTPRGKKWSYNTVIYWRQSEQELQAKRERFRQYWGNKNKKRIQPQTVIFRNADLRQRQNGMN